MSKRESNERGMPGYFLSEDGQRRLAKLGECIRLLARLTQPRASDDQLDQAPEVRMEQLVNCLELLAEQAELVLAQVSWPAYREAATGAPGPTAEAMQNASGEASERFAFGVTLDQIDALDRLIQMISAHSDVLAAGHAGALADHTLPLLGQAIFNGAKMVRDVLDEVEAQRLWQARGPGPRTGVGEESAMYDVGLTRVGMYGGSHPVLPPLASPLRESVRQSHRLRPH